MMKFKLTLILLLCFAQTSPAKLERGDLTTEVIVLCATGAVTAIDLLNKGLLFSELKVEAQSCQDSACRNVTSTQKTNCAIAIGFETLVPVAALTTLAGVAFAEDRVEGVAHFATLFTFVGSSTGFAFTIVGLVTAASTRWTSSTIMMSATELGALIAASAAIYRIRENRARVSI